MHSLYQFLKTTVVGGLLVLVPVAVCVYIISAVIEKVLKVLGTMVKPLHVKSVAGTTAVEVAAVLVVIAACFLFGLLLRTAVGQSFGGWVEEKILNLLPGYQLIKKVSRQFAGGSEAVHWSPVLIKIGDSRQIGFLVEEHTSGDATVFVPAAPAVSVGAVHIVKAELVEKLDVSMRQAVDCITQLGMGSSTLSSIPQPYLSPTKCDS